MRDPSQRELGPAAGSAGPRAASLDSRYREGVAAAAAVAAAEIVAAVAANSSMKRQI